MAPFLAARPATGLHPQEVAISLDPSVVRIFVAGPDKMVSGSGIVVNREGYVAKNFHVIFAHRSWAGKFCGEVIEHCVEAVDRAIRKLRS